MDEITSIKPNVPYSKIPFEYFYKEQSSVAELVKKKEWKDVYSNFYNFDKYELEIKKNDVIPNFSDYPPQYHAKIKEIHNNEIIKCVKSFFYFCHRYLKIAHPMLGLIPCILYKYQRRVIEEYNKHRFNIISKFRQGGLTTVSVLWALWRCMFKTDQQILVLSKTDREAMVSGEIVKLAIDHMPEWLKPQLGKYNDHQKQFIDTNSNLSFHTPEAARGKAITVLIIDEAAFIKDMDTYWAAIYPVISTGGACCVISTVNGLGNWYEETYHEAESGENNFHVIDLDYWEHPAYADPDWEKISRPNMGEKKWKQEILRVFLGSGDTYIDAKIINELDLKTRGCNPLRLVFDKWANKESDKKTEWDTGALWIWKEPIDGHEYIIGVDCAEGMGSGGDNSCFQIIDALTMEQVAEFYSNTIPPYIFAQVINEIGYYYNTALVAVEYAGQGMIVVSNLQHELSYENIYYEVSGKVDAPGIKSNKSKRSMLLQSLQYRLDNGSIKINSRRFVRELKTFIFNAVSKRAEAQKGKHDDAIISLAIALYVRDHQMRGIPVGAEVPEESIKIFKTDVYEEIKKEIAQGSPEDWIAEYNDEKALNPSQDEFLSPVSFDIKRKYDRLLKEFNW